jgi:hypothetical protein
MAASSKGPREEPEIELHPDAWERFTEFVRRLAKAGPQHRKPKPEAQQREKKGKD